MSRHEDETSSLYIQNSLSSSKVVVMFRLILIFNLSLVLLAESAWTECLPVARSQEILFEDRFEGALKPGWEWLRSNAPCRRFVDNSLEIFPEPFSNSEARNVLFRPLRALLGASDALPSSYCIETECYFLKAPTSANQQCGIYWIRNDRVVFKLVFANVEGKMYVFPGKVPVDTPGGKLRITLTGHNLVAEFSGLHDSSFRRVYEGRINYSLNDRISLQCWGGEDSSPASQKEEQWVRFCYFKAVKLGE